MTTNLYLDTRTADDSGLAQVKIAINHRSSSTYIGTGVRVEPALWERKAQKVSKRHPQSTRLNIILSTKKLDVDNAIEALRKGGGLKGLSLPKIRKAVLEYLSPESKDAPSDRLIARMERYRDAAKKLRTWQTYDETIRRIRDFDPRADRLRFEDITHLWLRDFDAFLAKTSPSANARNIKMRNIRAVFNEAINDEVTDFYPFRRFKIRPQATPSREMTAEQVRLLFNYDCDATQREYLDMFKLSFFLAGINVVDLVHLKEVRDGRVECLRSKTGQPFSVRLEPEARAIIERYRGEEWLINVLDRYKRHEDYLHRMNTGLKRIGIHYDRHAHTSTGEPLFPKLSSYYARYAWANIAAELDVPDEVIDAALGHKKKGVVSVYVRINYNRKVDEANRRVIDYVLGGKATSR